MKARAKVDVKEEVELEVSQERERLFSNVNAETLQHEPGSVAGSMALVAGTTVGAGILALPAVTQDAGYLPSSAVILGCWAFSCVTGLLLAETNIRLMCELGRGGVSMLSMAKTTCGKTGQVTAGVTYVFLHYALMVAYISRGGELLASFIDTSPALASLAFTALLGTTVYASEAKVLDRVNTALVAGVILSFLGILVVALVKFDASQLSDSSASKAFSCIPVVALSFVYHNIIPTVSSNLEGDRRKITLAILGGTGIPLVMFLLWNAAILGYHVGGDGSLGTDPLKILQEDPGVGTYIMAFSLLAVATSFIGFVLGLVDFVADGMKLPTNTRSVLPFALTVAPPSIFALLYPDVFLKALDLAGTYGVLALFGVLPAGMAWQARQREDLKNFPNMVPGGVPVLLLVGGSAMGVIAQQTLVNVGAI